ncbi:MAG: DUF11 domain-containing protein, partial [Caldilineaceae bacterium]|nr:DUF11 domain-containing protein [Caldilineaceae bacterium]
MIAVLTLLPGLVPFIDTPVASAHNLDQRMVYMFFDPDTQATLDARIAGGWVPGTPLLQTNDEIGLIIKVIPTDGTDTGVGGYVNFYVPDGVEVIDAAYVLPDGSGGYTDIPMKGQAPMPAVGAGGDPTPNLVGITRGPNILGTTSKIVTDANKNLGTLPGVYGDMGIFYSTDPDTAFDSWRAFWGGTGPLITNNSGDQIGHRTTTGQILNKWDAEQMYAYGMKSPNNPIIDSNGRGTAPWGMANVVAGPQSGYAWQFDLDAFQAAGGVVGSTATKAQADAAFTLGPWQRIRYPGSQISDDPPGANPAVQPYTRGADGSTVGWALSSANPLPANTKTVRWAIGQLTENRPEWVRVKVRITNAAAYYLYNNSVSTIQGQQITAQGCPVFFSDTYGGDAGGDSNGKDHIWRYYDPSDTAWNGCVALGKPTDLAAVAVGQTYQYKVNFYNAGQTTLTNVVVKDTLPGGVQFISAVPAQNSGPNPLTWNLGTLQPGQKFEALVTVKATSNGPLENCIEVTSAQLPAQTVCETIPAGPVVILNPQKSVTPTTVVPGGTVRYTVDVTNVGTATSGNPVVIRDVLPAGFTYAAAPAPTATVNGASVTPSVNAADPSNPIFTIPAGIAAGKKLVLEFSAQVNANQDAGTYCNRYTVSQNGVNLPTGLLACVNVGAAEIGDEVWRDWNGNGIRDPEDEGLPGVNLTLTPGAVPDTTDANGTYLYEGLSAGTYTVNVTPPSGYTQTYDPDATVDNAHTVTVSEG